MSKVFISGSISTKELPSGILQSLEKIQKHNMTILVGDADGIDKAIQDYCEKSNYKKMCVYSIYSSPRYLSSNSFEKKFIYMGAFMTVGDAFEFHGIKFEANKETHQLELTLPPELVEKVKEIKPFIMTYEHYYTP